EDAAGEALQHLVEAAGVRCRLMRSRDFQTVTKVRVVSQHQQLLRLDYEGPMSTEAGALLEECKRLLPDAHCVVLSDYAKGSLGRVREIIEAAGRAGLMVLVDPKGRDFSRYRGATLLTPNQREFEDVAVRPSADADLRKRPEALAQAHALEELSIARGERGMTLVQRNAPRFLHHPALMQEVYDVTGAGDTVMAVLAAVLVSGYP